MEDIILLLRQQSLQKSRQIFPSQEEFKKILFLIGCRHPPCSMFTSVDVSLICGVMSTQFV